MKASKILVAFFLTFAITGCTDTRKEAEKAVVEVVTETAKEETKKSIGEVKNIGVKKIDDVKNEVVTHVKKEITNTIADSLPKESSALNDLFSTAKSLSDMKRGFSNEND